MIIFCKLTSDYESLSAHRRSRSLCRWSIVNLRFIMEFCEITNGKPPVMPKMHEFQWKSLTLTDSTFRPTEETQKATVNLKGILPDDLQWILTLRDCYSFKRSNFDLPEEKFRHLWSNLFTKFLVDPLLSHYWEFRMTQISGYTDQKVDYVTAIAFDQYAIPILLCEAAGAESGM
jgi:hypothetical protein